MIRRVAPPGSFTNVVYRRADVQLPVVIRGARHDDLAKLEWFGTYTHFRDIFQRTWADHVAGRRLMLVADLNDFPAGQVWLDMSPTEYAYVYAFRVWEPLRGGGIGTLLLQTAQHIAKEQGFAQVQLAVERTNSAALHLYERLGYHTFSQRIDVWSYVDQHGTTHWVEEDVWGMRRWL